MPDRKGQVLRNPILACAGLLLMSSASCESLRSQAQQKIDCFKLLVEAFNRKGDFNVIAIVSMMPQDAHLQQTIKMVISKDGKEKITVLSPLEQTGFQVVDTGSTRQVYDPDAKTLTTGPSPYSEMVPPRQRMRMIRKNYHLVVTRNVLLAGQNAIKVHAVAVAKKVGALDLYIDPKSYFLMRTERMDSSGQMKITYDTLSLSYPVKLASDSFELQTKSGTTVQQDPPPQTVGDPSAAKKVVGFTPVFPKAFPMGFALEKAYISGNSKNRTVGVRISDGLASATIFQFKKGTVPARLLKHGKESRDVENTRTLSFLVFSDLPREARADLLRTFTSSALRHKL